MNNMLVTGPVIITNLSHSRNKRNFSTGESAHKIIKYYYNLAELIRQGHVFETKRNKRCFHAWDISGEVGGDFKTRTHTRTHTHIHIVTCDIRLPLNYHLIKLRTRNEQ